MPIYDVANEPSALPAELPRRFGVELEFVGITQDAARTAIASINGERGRGSRWIVKSDGSVSPRSGDQYGTCGELVSPPLHSSEEGFAEVKRVCQAMTAAGGTVNKTCGFHVHVDAAGLSGADIAMVISRYAANEELINRWMAPSRVENNHYCRPASRIYGRAGEQLSLPVRELWMGSRPIRTIAGTFDRYCTVNIAAYVRHGTIEFRQHAGTMNWRKVTSWVRFLVSFVEQSREQVRSRVERFLLSTDSAPVSPEQMHWSNHLLSTGNTTLGMVPLDTNIVSRRFDISAMTTESGRRISRNQARRWSNKHAFKMFFKYYIRRWTVALIKDWTERSIERHGENLYHQLTSLVDSCYPNSYTLRQSALLLAFETARETICELGCSLRTTTAVNPVDARVSMFRDNYRAGSIGSAVRRPNTNVVYRSWMAIRRFDLTVPLDLAVWNRYLALPDLGEMRIPGSVGGYGVEMTEAIFSRFYEERAQASNIPAGVSIPPLSELTGPENLWLGVSSRVMTYLQARETEMQATRAAREEARRVRREARAAATSAQSV